MGKLDVLFAPRRAAWAGVLGPLLFLTVFLVEGWLRPGYDARSEFVSALSLGPRGGIQIASFVAFGALHFVFARGVARTFVTGRASKAGPRLLTIIAVSLFASGPFVMDPAGTPPSAASWHGLLHQLFGAVVFSCMPAVCFVLAWRFRDDARWRSFHAWTLVTGVVIVVAVLALKLAQRPPVDALAPLAAWAGLCQRAALVPYLVWLCAFALGVRRVSPA